MKKIYFALILLVILLISCNNGSKILFVQIDDDIEPSNIDFVQKSLDIGGLISLDVDTARNIDNNFDAKYAVGDENDNFLVIPALLNFVGGQGWSYIDKNSGQYIFTKRR